MPLSRLHARLAPVVLALAASSAHAAPAFEDAMAERVQACTGCHGEQGRAGPDGFYPRIAGKPAGYLYHQLLNFRDGRRRYPLMTHLLEPLTDRYLLEIAQHFAGLDVPYPPPSGRSTTARAARGEALVRHGDPARGVPSCAQCHGAALTGVLPAVPGLLGLPRDYLNAQFGAWRTGQRRAHAPDCMREVAVKLAPEDIDAVSSWLATQPVPAPTRPAASAPAPLPCGDWVLEPRP